MPFQNERITVSKSCRLIFRIKGSGRGSNDVNYEGYEHIILMDRGYHLRLNKKSYFSWKP